MSFLSNKRNLIILIALIVIVGASLFYFLNSSKPLKQTQPILFQPDGTNNSLVTKRDPKIHADKTQQFRIEYGKIRTQLPLEKGDVRLVYKEDLGFITANIKDVKTENDFLAKKLTMENYLKSQGVSDLCGLAITWIPPQDLKVPVKDTLSPNCTF